MTRQTATGMNDDAHRTCWCRTDRRLPRLKPDGPPRRRRARGHRRRLSLPRACRRRVRPAVPDDTDALLAAGIDGLVIATATHATRSCCARARRRHPDLLREAGRRHPRRHPRRWPALAAGTRRARARRLPAPLRRRLPRARRRCRRRARLVHTMRAITLRPGAAARRLHPHLRRDLPRLLGARLRHRPLRHRPRGRRASTRPAPTGARTSSAAAGDVDTGGALLTLDDGTLAS